MKNSYPFFNQYKGRLNLVAMAVQAPTLTYTNPKTTQPFTREEFVAFAENYLGRGHHLLEHHGAVVADTAPVTPLACRFTRSIARRQY